MKGILGKENIWQLGCKKKKKVRTATIQYVQKKAPAGTSQYEGAT